MTDENSLWRKQCKKNGWVVTRSIVNETPNAFDYRKFFSEKTLLSKPGSVKWTEPGKTHGTMPSKRFKHSATVVGRHIIFIGGQETDTKRFNDIFYFDTRARTFSQYTIKGDRIPNFSRHTSCLVGSKIYVFGGFDGHGTNFDLAIFDPYARHWTNVAADKQKGTPPASRTNHAAAVVGKNMYIWGGNNKSDTGKYQVLNDLSVLNTITMTWTTPKTTGDIPCARSGHTLTAVGKKLYLYGGGVWNATDGWVHKYNDVHILDTETMHWTTVKCTGAVDSSTFPISFSLGRFMFVFGGGSQSQSSVNNDLYILDTATLSWMKSAEENKPAGRDMGSASVVGDTVYFVGGYASGPLECFDQLTISCAPSLSPPALSGSASC